DIYFVSRMDASEDTIKSAIAALSLHESFNNVILALGVGLSIAAMAIISQYIGAKREDKARFYAGQFVFLSFIVGAVLTLFIVSLSWAFVGWMGTTGETYDFALEYFNIRAFELPFVIFFLVYQSIRQSQGSTIMPTVYNIVGILLNILLTWYFVSELNMGVAGSAWATLIGNAVFTPFMLYDLFRSKKYIRVEPKGMLPRKAAIAEIWPFAYPAAISQAVTFFGFLLINSFILSQFGDVISASFATGNKLSNLLMNPIYAITSISAVFIGANIGHKQPERAMKVYKESGILTFSLTVISITIAILFREEFVKMLVGDEVPELVSISVEYTFWLLLTQPAMAIFQNFMAIFNGSGQSKLGLKAQSFRLWALRIPLIIILWQVPKLWGYDLGYSIIWTAMNISNVLALFHAYRLKKNIVLDIKVNLNDEQQIEVAAV